MEKTTRLVSEAMAPKVRHPKAKPGPLRRPAAVGGGAPPRVRRDRRGAGGERRKKNGEDPESKKAEAVPPRPCWASGDECRLLDLDLKDLQAGQEVVLKDAAYYGVSIKVSGRIVKVMNEGDDWFIALRLIGTTSEPLLQVYSSDPLVAFHCHLCPPDCGQMETGDFFLHASHGRLVRDVTKEEPWVHNLERGPREGEVKEDELAELRRRSQEMAPLRSGVKRDQGAEKDSEDEPSKKKKKKEKKDSSKKERSKKLSGKKPVSACQKEPKELFGGTGLDPRDRVRRRVLRKARKYLAKKGKTSSSSGSSSRSESESRSGSTEDALEEREGLFNDGNRVRAVAEKFPGALCCEALRSMRESLMTEEGDDITSTGPRAVAVKYFRQQVQRRAVGPVGRDMLNVASALDLILKGKVAGAADLLAQRLKSSEATLNGTHWSVSLKMEVPQPENLSIAPRSEVQQAQRENYTESRVAYLASLGPGRRVEERYGKGKSEKGGKGKWENPHKGDRKGEKGKGKGKEKEAAKGGAEK